MISDILISQLLLGASPPSVWTSWLDEQEVTPMILQSFQMKSQLNPSIWSKKQLIPDVRSRLLAIARSFYKQLDTKVPLSDVTLTGSIANYNWSEFSDVDLHLRIDFSKIDENEKLVRDYMLAQKNYWNATHKLDINGIPIEVYVENVGDTHVASGLYSILRDEWIVKPKPKKLMIDLDDVKTKADAFVAMLPYLHNLDASKAADEIKSVKEKLKRLRAAGLESGGEFSVENLAFKSLRRSGFIEELNRIAAEVLK